MRSPTLGLIVSYFGEAPAWTNVFLASCRENPDVDFLIFSDCIKPDIPASNLHFFPCSPKDIQDRCNKILGLNISLSKPLKICDLRPAFGLLFEEELREYDFWGHVDVDVIFGRIRHFIGDNLLHGYDIISTRKEYLSGHFTIYRNTERCNTLFKEGDHFQTVFEDTEYHNFDECHFNWHALLKQESPKPGPNITKMVQEAYIQGHIRLFMEDLAIEYVDLPPSYWLFWSNGSLYNLVSKKEVMYHHFHAAKKSTSFSISCSLTSDCLISKAGIHSTSNSLKYFLNTPTNLAIG